MSIILLKGIFIIIGKWFTKKEKLNILKYYWQYEWSKTFKKFNIADPTLIRWKRELAIKGDAVLEPRNGEQSKGIRRSGRPKNIDFNAMTKEELIQYIKIVEDVKKFLTKSKKKKFQMVWSLKKNTRLNIYVKF